MARPPKPDLDRILHRQQGVIARRQAILSGLAEAALRHRIRAGGPWQRLLPGVYLAATGTPTVDQREMAAQLYAGPDSVITGAASLRRQGIKAPGTTVIDLLVPATKRCQSTSGVRVLYTTRVPQRVIVMGARHYAFAPRAIGDAARSLTDLREVRAIVADAVQTRRCRLDLIVDELRQGPIRGSALLRQAVAEIMDGIRSTAEGDLQDLIKGAMLPVPMLNPRLYVNGEFIAEPDEWWPDAGVAAEVDSREYHLSPDDWQHTMERHARMSSVGIIVLHFTPAQIRNQPGDVAETIRRALSSGRARPRLPIDARPASG